jgi:hypothetical protein
MPEDQLLENLGLSSLFNHYNLGGISFVTLGARGEKHAHKHFMFDRVQLKWLEDTLGNIPHPVVILSHFPLVDFDLRENRWFDTTPETCFPINKDEVVEIITRSGRVPLVLQGHAHEFNHTIKDGTSYVTLQSVIESDSPSSQPSGSYAVLFSFSGSLKLHCFGQPRRDLEWGTPQSRKH